MFSMPEHTGKSKRKKPLHEYAALSCKTASSHIYNHYGINSVKYNAIEWIGTDTVIIAAGQFVLFINVNTQQMEWQRGPEYGGIGCIAVHPSHSTFVIGERARHFPRLLVHDWPSRHLEFTLPWSPHDDNFINNDDKNTKEDNNSNENEINGKMQEKHVEARNASEQKCQEQNKPTTEADTQIAEKEKSVTIDVDKTAVVKKTTRATEGNKKTNANKTVCETNEEASGVALIGYAACAFNKEGNRLATVSASPDYILAVWNWTDRSLLLRNKCFGADVYTIAFSAFDSAVLVSCGSGHIKFWTVANTFTGLKLHGTLGKFNRVEISNISACVVLPHGEVLSGSENGNLLLWQGDLIKCSFVHSSDSKVEESRQDDKPFADYDVDDELTPTHAWRPEPLGDNFNYASSTTNTTNVNNSLHEMRHGHRTLHNGAITVVKLIHNNEFVLTAGEDGKMKYFRRTELEHAEPDNITYAVNSTNNNNNNNSGGGSLLASSPSYAPKCLLEISVTPLKPIRSITLKTVERTSSEMHQVNEMTKQEWIILALDGTVLAAPYPSAEEIANAELEKDRLGMGKVKTTPVELEQSIVRYTPSFTPFQMNGRPITSSIISPCDHTILIGSADGAIRLIDYLAGKELAQLISLPEESSVVTLHHMHSYYTEYTTNVNNTEIDNDQQFEETLVQVMYFFVAYENGIVQLLCRRHHVRRTKAKTVPNNDNNNNNYNYNDVKQCNDVTVTEKMEVIQQLRPHTGGLCGMAFSEAEDEMCTMSNDGVIFFFHINKNDESNYNYNNINNKNGNISQSTQVNSMEMETSHITFEPVACCQLPLSQPRCVAWDEEVRQTIRSAQVLHNANNNNNGGCLVGFASGEILAIAAPTSSSVIDPQTFYFNCSYALVGIRQRKQDAEKMQPFQLATMNNWDDMLLGNNSSDNTRSVGTGYKPQDQKQSYASTEELESSEQEEEKEEEVDLLAEEDNGPWPVNFIRPLSPARHGEYVIGMSKNELAYTYKCGIRYPDQLRLPPLPPTGREPANYVEEPIANWCYRDRVPTCAFVSGPSQHNLIVITDANEMILRDVNDNRKIELLGQAHDCTEGEITGAFISFDENLVVSTGSDGVVVTQVRSGHTVPLQVTTLTFTSDALRTATTAATITTTRSMLEAATVKLEKVKVNEQETEKIMEVAHDEESQSALPDIPHIWREGKSQFLQKSDQLQKDLLSTAKREVTKLTSTTTTTTTAAEGGGGGREDKIASLPLSIQAQKEADEQAAINAAKKAKLDAIVQELSIIHDQHEEMIRLNSTLPLELRLNEDEMQLDATLQSRMEKEIERRVAEARKEYLVDSARGDVLTRKLRNRFIDNLLYDRFVLHAFSDAFQVSSFRTCDPVSAIQRLEANIAELECEEKEEEEEEENDQQESREENEKDQIRERSADNKTQRCTESIMTNRSASKERTTKHCSNETNGAIAVSSNKKHEKHNLNDNLQQQEENNKNNCIDDGKGGKFAHTMHVPGKEENASGEGNMFAQTDTSKKAETVTNPSIQYNTYNASNNNTEHKDNNSINTNDKVTSAMRQSAAANIRGTSSSVRHHLSKLDQRREERRIRSEEEKILFASAPNPAEEDAALRTRIEQETLTRGECVLRTEDHYKHTHEFRPSAGAKLRRMIELEKYMVSLREEFNVKLIALRSRKVNDLARINVLRASIANINKELNDFSVDAAVLSLFDEEKAPEDAFTVTRTMLDAFEDQKELERQHAEEAKKAQRGFGADLANAAVATNPSTNEQPNTNVNNNNNNNNKNAGQEKYENRNTSMQANASRGWVSRSIQSHPRVSMSVSCEGNSINLVHVEDNKNNNTNSELNKRERMISFPDTAQMASGHHDENAEHESWENTNASNTSHTRASHTHEPRHTLVPAMFANSLTNTNANASNRDGYGAGVGVIGVIPTATHDDVNSSSNINMGGNLYNTSFTGGVNPYGNLNTSSYNVSGIHMMPSLGSTTEHYRAISPTKASFRGSRRMSRMDRGARQSTVFLSVNRERMDAELRTKLENIKLTEAEEEERKMNEYRLRSERQRLVLAVQEIMSAYDKELESLRAERAHVDVDLCLVKNKLLLLFREYQLLLVYRQKDASLREQHRAVKAERENVRRSLADMMQDIHISEAKITSLQDKLKTYKRKTEEYIRENGPSEHVPYLLKVFYRHMKRRKRKDDNDDDDDDDITSDDEDENDELNNNGRVGSGTGEDNADFNNNNNNGEEDDNVITEEDLNLEEMCPMTCPEEFWIDLLCKREAKLDLVDAIADLKLHLTQVKRNREVQIVHREELENKLQGVRSSIDELIIEKKRELNKLTTVVPLRKDQICYEVHTDTSDGHLFTDFSNEPVIVINDSELERLRLRIGELEEMKRNEEEEVNNMVSTLTELKAEKSKAQKVYKEWDSRVNEVMLLKFGQRVDLDYLESCGTSWRIEEKKEELRQRELYWERMCRMYEREIASIRAQISEKTQENTSMLHTYGDDEEVHQEIAQKLELATAKTLSKFKGTQIATLRDRVSLRELISAQREEMEALRTEIAMLRRKGGHAYSPSMYEMEEAETKIEKKEFIREFTY